MEESVVKVGYDIKRMPSENFQKKLFLLATNPQEF
jgi:hypothetical protein